jgi:uncharacterized protein YdaU (DUF1376 family)
MSGRGMTWYKRDPIRFVDGVQGLGPDVIGAYAVLLDLMYARGGETMRDDRHLAGVLGCSVRLARALTDRLIEVGKVEFHDGFVSNSRAKSQAKQARTETEAKSNAQRERREREAVAKESKDLADKLVGVVPPKEKRREDKITPTPFGFDDFWKAYPRKIARANAAKAYAKAVAKADPATILAGVRRYAETAKGIEERFIAHPATWLNGERWADEAPAKANGNVVDMGWFGRGEVVR